MSKAANDEPAVANVVLKAKPLLLDVANRSHEGLRVERWRHGNRERYNARMSEYMRKRRLKLREAKPA